ncbi:hypothetical protein IC620_16430 [Hazenella sp. IB182357]|uniref:Uncharacterized protein n=1 Tax=Polycladospora coralii TaxID=2771432 RepID=A0A926NCW4_9BACL|nr:hypothetical protein [Polycladospora coralii]MBD1373932.1 hypothetical protein [Polycladospora coralii]MBS7531996.1 hypothetical protein [Polycladospora coralii]
MNSKKLVLLTSVITAISVLTLFFLAQIVINKGLDPDYILMDERVINQIGEYEGKTVTKTDLQIEHLDGNHYELRVKESNREYLLRAISEEFPYMDYEWVIYKKLESINK